MMSRIFHPFTIAAFVLTFVFAASQNMYAQSKNSQYQMIGKSEIKTVELTVDGMTCQKGCADGIDRKFKTVPGVVKSKTTLSTGKSVITYDESVVKVSDLIAVIEKKGYKAKLADATVE
jgi:Cu+-exporting ATPase